MTMCPGTCDQPLWLAKACKILPLAASVVLNVLPFKDHGCVFTL